MIAGLYRPGDSPVHRLPAAAKLLALLAAATLLFAAGGPWIAGVTLACVLAGYRLAGMPLAIALRQLRPLLAVLVVLFLAQWWIAGWQVGLVAVLRLAALVLAAALVTLTTRTADLVGVVETCLRPLSRVGLDVEKASLAISLAIRFVPAIAQAAEEVREAQSVRGAGRNPFAIAVPLIVRLLKMADAIAEAIDARS